MATRSKRWTSAKARVVVEELEASGLSMAAFARQQGLSYERVRKWRCRLRREAAASRPRLVELVARQPEPEPVARLAVHCPSGHSVELADVELATGLRIVLTAIAELG